MEPAAGLEARAEFWDLQSSKRKHRNPSRIVGGFCGARDFSQERSREQGAVMGWWPTVRHKRRQTLAAKGTERPIAAKTPRCALTAMKRKADVGFPKPSSRWLSAPR